MMCLVLHNDGLLWLQYACVGYNHLVYVLNVITLCLCLTWLRCARARRGCFVFVLAL